MMSRLLSSAKCPRRSASLVDNNSNLDYISVLPNDLLVNILDRLPLEEARSTILLSKSWKDLWKSKTKVEIDYRWAQKTGMKVLPSLLSFIDGLGKQRVQCMNVSLRYNLSMSNYMQSLIEKASLKQVEELYIDFNDKNDNRTTWRRRYLSFIVPESELPHSSLVKLSLLSLQLQALPPRSFVALKELFLERVKLGEDSVQKITCNCPVLAFLCLSNCNPITDLKVIVAENSNLLHLVIREEFTEVSNKTKLYIKAKDLISIEFGLALPRKQYHLIDTLASEAIFRLNKMLYSLQAMRVTISGIKGNAAKNFMGLLKNFIAAKVLTLCSWCIQVLSIETVNFGAPLSFEAQHLILETGLEFWEFPGIAYMLLGCSKLISLVILMGSASNLKFDFVENMVIYRFGPPLTFGEIMKHLAVVEFKNDSGTYQTWEDGNFSEASFFADSEHGRLLLWNFRTYAASLQKMIFTTGMKRFETNQFRNFGDLPSYAPFECPKLPTLYTLIGSWAHLPRRL